MLNVKFVAFKNRFLGRRLMMKKLIFVLTVLAIASVSNAALKISVNGVVDPPDTQIVLKPSETAVIDIWGDGQTPQPWDGWLIAEGPGTTANGVLLYQGSLSSLVTFAGDELAGMKAWLESIGYNAVGGVSNAVFADGAIPSKPLEGKLVDEILFHCEARGDVLLTLVNIFDPGTGEPPTLTVMDTQIIHQIPEPITLALLGLGGLFLRRRK